MLEFCDKYNLPYAYFNGKELIHNKDNLDTKTASDQGKNY